MSDRTVLDLYRHDVECPREDHYAHWTPDGRRSISTIEFLERTSALADALAGFGVAEGDRVMLLSDNRPEWHMVDLAVLDLGAVDVPVYQTLTADQIAYQLNDSGSTVAIVETAEHVAVFASIRDRCPSLQVLIQIEGECGEDVLAFADLVSSPREDSIKRFWDRSAAIDENSLATIIYTSGTTGEPKGVMLSHRNLVQDTTFTNRRLEGGPSDLALEFLPLCHTAERLAGYCYMQKAMFRAYCSVELVGQVIGTVRPTIFFAVPRVHEKVYQKVVGGVEAAGPVKRWLFHWALAVGTEVADRRLEGQAIGGTLALRHRVADRLVLSRIRGALGGRVRFCITGGAAIPQYVSNFFHAVGIPLVDAYGLTETSPVMVLGGLRQEDVRRGWAGRALENLEVKLADDGEILVKGPVVMMGYWNKPEQTADAFDGEGFLKTGDIGEMDGDGFVRIVDRKRELIVTSGGKNVAPQSIEARLKQSPLVDVAVLIGDGRHFISAIVAPDFDELEAWARANDVTAEGRDALVTNGAVRFAFSRIVDEVNGQLARYERIREFRLIPETLSVEGGHLTPTMKVKRRVIDTDFAEVIRDIYSN